MSEELGRLWERYRELLGPGGPYGRGPRLPEWFLHLLSFRGDLFLGFLRDCRLIKPSTVCSNCGKTMTIKRTNKNDGLVWSCDKKMSDGRRCYGTKSIRDESWFMRSRLRIEQILCLTYKILYRQTYEHIMNDLDVSSRTIAEWTGRIKETLVDFLDRNSEVIGGEGVPVEVDEARFGKRRYSRGRFTEGQLVLGGFEGRRGGMFLVGLGAGEALAEALERWLAPGSLVVAPCWEARGRLPAPAYRRLTRHHRLRFVGPRQGAPLGDYTPLLPFRAHLPSVPGRTPLRTDHEDGRRRRVPPFPRRGPRHRLVGRGPPRRARQKA